MLAKVHSGAVYGVDAYPVEIEVNTGRGDPQTVILGPMAAIRPPQLLKKHWILFSLRPVCFRLYSKTGRLWPREMGGARCARQEEMDKREYHTRSALGVLPERLLKAPW